MIKDISYYMSLPYRVLITPDNIEGGYAASCPELPGCITCADTLPELWLMIEDAKLAWLTAELEDGHEIPEPFESIKLIAV